jgi:hypothetical protein
MSAIGEFQPVASTVVGDSYPLETCHRESLRSTFSSTMEATLSVPHWTDPP